MKIFLVLFLSLALFLVNTSEALAAVDWTEIQPAGDTTPAWYNSAISSDGQIILVSGNTGRLYITTNGGYSWTETQPAGIGTKQWAALSTSSNGQKMIAGVYDGRIYLSGNAGGSWSETAPTGTPSNIQWQFASMSNDGQTILVGTSSRLYLTTNGGTSWAETRPAGDTNNSWYTGRVSGNGSVFIAGINFGRIYRSINSGGLWAETQPLGNTSANWTTTAVSTNGSVILAASSAGRVWLSTNTGGSWAETRPAGDSDQSWEDNSIAVSGDGVTMLAGVQDGELYISTNTGGVWSQTTPGGQTTPRWRGVNINSDGSVLFTAVNLGRVYISPAPVAPPSASSSAPSSVYHPPAGFGPPVCANSAPTNVPDLFQIDPAGTYVNLYFTTVAGANGYNVNYGLSDAANQYGDQFFSSTQEWTVGRQINGLSPNTTYYFKVQPVNGCATGNWSKTVSVKTKSQFANISQFFANLNLLSNQPKMISDVGSQRAAVAGVSKIPDSCSYVVEEGDSLWSIAQQKWGSGVEYSQIVELNSGLTAESILNIGQTIKLCK